MKRVLLLILTIAVSVAGYSMPTIFKGSLEEALAKAKNEDKSIYIFFTAQWCGPCKVFKEKILFSSDIIEKINDKYIFIYADSSSDVEQYALIARRYKVGDGFPEHTIVNSDGKIVNSVNGAILDKERFITTLNSRYATPQEVVPREVVNISNNSGSASKFNKLIGRLSLSKYSIGVSPGVKFSYMTNGLTEIATGYNIDLSVYRRVERCSIQFGLNFNSSGGKSDDIKYVSNNIRIPVSLGVDLFKAATLG